MLQLQHQEERLTQERARLRVRIQQIAGELEVIQDRQFQLHQQASKVIPHYGIPAGAGTRALYGNTRTSAVNANLLIPLNDVPAGIHNFGPGTQPQ